MKIGMITCWYNKKVYGYYSMNLKNAIERDTDCKVNIITSKCSCYSGKSSIMDGDCELVTLNYCEEYRSKKKWKFYLTRDMQKNIILLI